MLIKNNFKPALRYFTRYKVYTIINVFGLALGLACSFLTMLYITSELSYDKYHKNAKNLYRITGEYSKGDRQLHSALIPVSAELTENIEEIESRARIFSYSWQEKVLLAYENKYFYEENFILADPEIFEVFSWTFIKGTQKTSLQGINSIVINESTAAKYFGSQDPMGKLLSVKNLGQSDFIVTGVIEDIPRNSHFQCDIIAPLKSGKTLFWDNFLERNSFYTYIRIKKDAQPAQILLKLKDVFTKQLGDESQYYRLNLQPVTKIHLHSHLSGELSVNSDVKYVYLFVVLSILILMIAGSNYISLATARSLKRAKEVGMRKVVGASRSTLVKQFLGESLLLTLISFPLATILVELLLPAFNSIINQELNILSDGGWRFFYAGLALTILVGLIAGIYPAFVLSRFQPIRVLKGKFDSKKAKARSLLVIFQYSVSSILIIGTLIIVNQMQYIKNKKLGFQKEHIIILPIKDYETKQNLDTLKTAWEQNSLINSVTASQALPSAIRFRHNVIGESIPDDDDMQLVWNAVDYNFFKTYGIQLKEGRSFSQEYTRDNKHTYILNEAAVKRLGWDSPVGKKIQLSNKNLMHAEFEMGEVIGVVKDFHHHSLHQEIEPMIMNIYPGMFRYVAISVNSANISGALEQIKLQWKRIVQNRPFDYFFFDDNVGKMYQAEQKLSTVFKYSAFLSIFIACLGLFGLASFSTSQRTKEIGIRKILGASVHQVIILMSKDFFRLLFIANVIAWPIAYLIMAKWLNNFTYRIELNILTFILASVLTLLISFITLSYQTIKSATANPIDSLRYE